MIYTKRKFGFDLKDKNKTSPNINAIAEWAFDLYQNPNIEFEDGIEEKLFKLIAMEEGPAFYLSNEEIDSIANSLIFSAEQKEIKLYPNELSGLCNILNDFCSEVHVNESYDNMDLDQENAKKILTRIIFEKLNKNYFFNFNINDLNLIIKIIEKYIKNINDETFEQCFGINKYDAKSMQNKFF